MGRFFLCILFLGTVSGLWAQSAAAPLHLQFRQSGAGRYRIEQPIASAKAGRSWIQARAEGSNEQVEIGSRVVVRLTDPEALTGLLAGSPLSLARKVGRTVFILQAPDALTAAREAHRLAREGSVSASSPVMRRARQLHGSYAYKPNDPYVFYAWHLEHRFDPGAGVDLNVRAAWPYTRGEGVIIGFGDDGIECTHPDLASRTAGMPHFNFGLNTTNGMPSSFVDKHGTALAGLAVADYNNGQGACGVAPMAGAASWKVFNTNLMASDEQLASMYVYSNDVVAVQNQSWGFAGIGQNGPSLLEEEAIRQATQQGRAGRGVVMVRSAGNDRISRANANDSGYPSNPNVIAVGAVWANGRATSYSTPGACLLVAAPGGDPSDPSGMSLFTTDRQGTAGYNYKLYSNGIPLSDYCFQDTAVWGTSAATPMISGIAALMLSANTNLSYRDVQQILIQCARHFDFADPDLCTNGAGFAVSHNVGFGIPDAGMAVRLAQHWPARPSLTNVTYVASTVTPKAPAPIPDDGLRVLVRNASNLVQSIGATPSMGIQADRPTLSLPLVDVGPAFSAITQNLTNKAALIKRGTNNFADKIQYAANAGAAFAVVYDIETRDRVIMGYTDFVPIPAVFISKSDGDILHDALLRTNLTAQLNLNAVECAFAVTNTLLCEHVAVRVNIQHPRRSGIRITLLSPQGTRSVLARVNVDTNSPCTDWTYTSTHHFYESSHGTWTVSVGDEEAGVVGSVQSASLTIYGTPIADRDHDGLDDAWEMAHFKTLQYGPAEDPDHDGFNNMREFLMGTDPLKTDIPFQIDLARYDEASARLSWSATANRAYQVLAGPDPSSLTVLTNIIGRFPEMDLLIPRTTPKAQFFQVRSTGE